MSSFETTGAHLFVWKNYTNSWDAKVSRNIVEFHI